MKNVNNVQINNSRTSSIRMINLVCVSSGMVAILLCSLATVAEGLEILFCFL